MEPTLAQYSLDEIQHLGQILGGVLFSVLAITVAFVAYKLIKPAIEDIDSSGGRYWNETTARVTPMTDMIG